MIRTLGFTALLAMVGLSGSVMLAQRPTFAPVTGEMLVKPSPDDWLMYSRTYDAQRFSPLRQITRRTSPSCRKRSRRNLVRGR